MSTLPTRGKISACAHACVVCAYNATPALYCPINNHFCVIRVHFVATSRLAGWMCDFECVIHHERGVREDLSPYFCDVCEFLGSNYCIPKRWPMGPFHQVCPPWLKPLVTLPFWFCASTATCIVYLLYFCCIVNHLICCSLYDMKEEAGAKIKRENNLQGDNFLSLPLPKLQKSKWRCSAGSALISV